MNYISRKPLIEKRVQMYKEEESRFNNEKKKLIFRAVRILNAGF